jgi:pyruvate dehydrogenase E1 component alpha subunit
MGTHVAKAISTDKNIASLKALGYEMQSYTLNGMDYFQLVEGFKEIKNYLLEKQKPVLVEVVTERFKGHSISDPGLYRSKEDLAKCLLKDPISYVKNSLIENQIINSDQSNFNPPPCSTCIL